MDAKPVRVSPLVESRRRTLEALAAGVKLLPSAFAVPLRVLELKRKPNTSIAEIAQAISVEPTLSARVLSLANSAAFAPPVPITRVTIAAAMIGLNNLLPLIFGVSFGGIFNKLGLPPAEQAMLWRASVLRAVTAREVQRMLAGDAIPAADREARAEEAFLAGLFLDVAIPVFYAADRSAWLEYSAALDAADRVAHELRLFGTDHMAAAERCAAALQIPRLYTSAAASHHNGVDAIRAATGAPASFALGVNAAAALPHRFKNVSAKDLHALATRVRLNSNLTHEALCELVQAIADGYASTMNLFADPEDAGATFKKFLQELGAEVADCMTHAIAANAGEVQNLREQEQQLRGSVASLEEQAVRAEFDPLTAVLTRAAFLKRLDRLLRLARQHGAGCVVGFVDMDDFKQVNDARGHAAGDAALVALGTRLAAAVRGRGIAGRMGGDEFVFAFVANPAAIESDAAAFAAGLRRIDATHGGRQFATTTSIGVVTLGSAADPSVTPERLLAEADAMMYEAKRAGKGRAAIAPRKGPAVSGASEVGNAA